MARSAVPGLALCLPLLLGACASVGEDYRAPDVNAAGAPNRWAAPGAQGERAAELTRWWTQFDDPLLSQLIDTAQAGSPTLAQALARIRQARAAAGTSRAAQLPGVSGSAGASRGTALTGTGIADTATASLDASWEIDLFGGTRRSVEAADARLSARMASWHDARVTLAAEVANAYAQRRQYELMVVLAEMDLRSRMQTHRLTVSKLDAGFVAPADVQRTEASVAESLNTLETQRGLCAQSLNQLVALTGVAYPDLEQQLESQRTQVPRAPLRSWDGVPAQALQQRPDVAAAERTLAAASAAIGSAQADRLPKLSLIGSIGVNQTRGVAGSTQPWSFGPSLSLPIFDGGKGAAAVESARGSYDEALGAYQASVRQAVQDVENALVRVATIARREGAADLATLKYQQYFAATQTQFELGAASLLQLEEARRLMLTSQQSQLASQLEQVQSWIALYKAVGGGWQPPAADASTVEPPKSPTSSSS